ncbi:non-ribosomal peptide synthetase [Nocardia aurantiaca]|uniref:Amino acid adenylation domain-containing protein n=1 Tax=Nocardia aurantiaca TaxID=2675850 RepID=A0A6I3KQ05_9NOCA|nr:non-ribosomal peptide synthetase [Nocardia aurantiaca]MTE11487.1 amino acid adenylation domain-containing protein [Nocardia aurantiaca]
MSDIDATVTVAGTSVADRRRELLRRRLTEQGLAAATAAPARRTRAGERRPLSAGQRRMWFLQTRDPEDATLNICVAYRLVGALDAQRLRTAVASVFARHDVLRTTFGVDEDGEPFQVFTDDFTLPWQSHDLTDLAESARSVRVEVLARREFGRPFDLAAELPLRITVVRTGTAEWVLLLAAHHSCWDDDAWAVFFSDLNAAYNGAEKAALTAQYVDIEVLDAPAEDDADIAYWRNTLRPLPEPLELPGSAVVAPSKRADRCTVALPADLLDRVDVFARARAASPFMVLLAGYAALIQRYTAADDFLVSIPVTNRRSAAAEQLVGYFGNTVLLRETVDRTETFTGLVEATRRTCLAAFAHQAVGIDRVVRAVDPERVDGRDGMDQLVRLGFSVRKSADGFALNGVTSAQLDELGAPTAQVPLALAVVTGSAHGAVLEAEYQVDVLSRPLVQRMLEHYVRLLDRALSTPAGRLADLDMLGGKDRIAILEQSRGADVPTDPATMVDLFEASVAAGPETLALVSDDIELTYAELNARANRLAHWLIREGLGSEDIVALRMSNSIEFIVAVYGVLKAGAAYLPIDPAYPDDRIDYLIADARPRLALGRVELGAAEEAAAGLPDTNPTDADRVRPLLPANLAYVIYTSGSTGEPKGVTVSHAAIAEHVVSFTAEWDMTSEDRLLQSSSVSFDASLLDIFVTLALGARLIVPKPDAFRDIRYIADLITRRGVTVLHMVPSMLSAFLLLPEVREWRALRHVPVGGEALPGEVADKFATVFDAELRNHYGPTEAVVCATNQPVAGPQGTGIVPIGVPNQNVHAYVLDEALQLVPAGVVGEIYLGGAQLARGYLGRPALTASRFVADPFTPGARLYRTGDLARRNEFGELDFVGRADEQVKVRGFRIELGEVESGLAAHPSVGHCVAIVVEDPALGAQLAAYLVPAAGATIDVAQVRAHAAAALPEYMVPSAFAVIDEIPLTVNGKLDKRALPAPSPAVERVHRTPATATERRLCGIYTRLFGVRTVGADDSFFELGGHSLLAARLVARIRAEFGVELDVRIVFDTPSPAGLAAGLVARFRDEFGIDLDAMDDEVDTAESVENIVAAPISGRPAVTERQRPERLPLSYSQLAMWFQCRMEGPSAVGNLPFAVRFDGGIDIAALRAALADVVARHEALRTGFGEQDGIPYQVVRATGEIELEISGLAADRLAEELAEIGRYAFTVDNEPLVRARLLVLDPGTQVLSLLVHHIVADHASLGILLEDLVAAYRSRVDDGRAPTWTPLTVQYPDYVLWQHDAFGASADGLPGEYGRAQLDYWRDALAGLPDRIDVAHDRPRPRVLGKRGELADFAVPAALRTRLIALAEACGATEFMVYQAAVATLLHKLGGGEDITLGTPVACRVDAETAPLVGLFANMAVLRNDLSGTPTLRDTVLRGREVVLGAHAHQELPIERLVEALNPPRSRSRNPLFQSMLHVRGADWAPAALAMAGDTTATVLPVDFDVSFLDLNISVNVTGDGGSAVRVVANADLYEPDTVQHIATALATTLEAYATAPDRTVAELEVLPVSDLDRLLAPPVLESGATLRDPGVPVAGIADTAVDSGHTHAGMTGAENTERVLIELLEELLDISEVEADDNFFALGGDSVISIQWSARATALGLALTPQLVFEHLTIAELAAAVDAAEPPAAHGEPTPREESAPMSASGLDAAALAALTASWQAR